MRDSTSTFWSVKLTQTQTQANAAFNAATMTNIQMPNGQFGMTHVNHPSPMINFNIVNGSVQEYVNKYHLFAAKTAENILGMCKVVHDANVHLQEKMFKQFCEKINLSVNSSTISKFLKIGSRYDQFIKYSHCLPNSWTSIYLITEIPAEEFDTLIAERITLANVTASEVNKILGKAPKPKGSLNLTEGMAASVYFTKVPTPSEWEVFTANLSQFTQNFNGLLSVEYSPKFEANYEVQLRGVAIAKLEKSTKVAATQQASYTMNVSDVSPFSEVAS